MGDTIKFLQDLANYGSHLILRCFISSQREIADVVLAPSLLKHMVSMLDGIIVLVSEGATLPAELALRSMFEARVSAMWILQKDTERRAKQYAVWHWRNDLDWARIAMAPEGTAGYLKREKWFKSKQKPKFMAIWDEGRLEATKDEKELLAVLNSADFKDINAEYERLRKAKTHDDHWYSLFKGPNNFRTLCGELGLHGHYDIFYTHSSKIAHATTFAQMLSHQKDSVILEPIRNLNEMQRIILFASSEAISAYRMLLGKYRPGELSLFNRRYLSEWQRPFLNIPKFQVEPQKTDIY